MSTPHDVPSSADQIPAGEWSSEKSASFEAALETVNHAIGAYSALIAEAESLGEGEERIDNLRSEREICIRDREALRPDDVAAVSEVRQRYAELVRRLKGKA